MSQAHPLLPKLTLIFQAPIDRMVGRQQAAEIKQRMADIIYKAPHVATIQENQDMAYPAVDDNIGHTME